jgi:thymidine kinase
MVVASLSAGHERSTLGLLNTGAFLAQCDSITWLQAVCCGCGVDTASVTHRHTVGPTLVGGAEQYEALCRGCHSKKMGD